MARTDSGTSKTWTSATIVDGHDLRFDAGDPLNGSLYLCTPRGAPAPVQCLAALRHAGLWSAESEKSVPDEQRAAYRDGLVFVAAARFDSGAGEVLIARFDHPKYPSDGDRWAAWVAHFEANYARLD